MFPSITASPTFRTWIKHPEAGARNYNGSTCATPAGLLHAWRSEDARGKSTVWIGRISKTGKITKAQAILDDPAYDAEDPRLFIVSGRIFVAWSKVRDTRHNSGQWHVVQMFAEIDPATLGVLCSGPIDLPLPLRHCEKNWTPLPDGGWIYDFQSGLSVTPERKIVHNRAWQYPWGSFSGSTPALPWPERGTWLAIFHGFMPDPVRVKRYYFGACEIDPATHRVLAISETPLVFASEEDDTIPCPRDAKYNPSVVFPTGLVRQDGGWLVSGGVHDSRDAWWLFSDSDLRLLPIGEALARRSLTASPEIAPITGWCRVAASGPLYEGGFRYKKGEEFLVTESRAAALGPLVNLISD